MSEIKVIAIGASTGGVDALLDVLSNLPADAPPVMITQHTGAHYSSSLAQLLDHATEMQVVEAQNGQFLSNGMIYLAPGKTHHMCLAKRAPMRINLVDAPPVDWHRPSITAMFTSICPFGAEAVGVILTGMGNDGAAGLLEMKKSGAMTIAQDEVSSVVYGMPKAAKDLGAARRQMPLSRIGPFLKELCSANSSLVKGHH